MASANACVSAELCEMNVAMFGHRAYSILGPERQRGRGGDLSDAAQWSFSELFLPAIQQPNRVGAAHGEEQFKIFAIGQGGEQWGFPGPRRTGRHARRPAN